jgi:bifunctional non-homologous end joining protein LigD
MQPALVSRPVHHAGWVYEEKVDGYRMVIRKEGDEVRLISRQGKDFTARFSELVAALVGLQPVVILDGEVAIYDQAHVSRFEWLRARPKDALATPPSSWPSTSSNSTGRTGALNRSGSGGRGSRN